MLIKTGPDIIESFLEDYSNLKGGFCKEVDFPETEEELRYILSDCSSQKIPVTISGAGTGVTGGRIPFGGRVISLSKLNRIEYINPLKTGGGEAVAEAGVFLKDFLDTVSGKGFFYPPDPTEKASFISGNIATSASGGRSLKYGTTRDFIKSLRIMLSDGDILQLDRGRYIADKRSMRLSTLSGRDIRLNLPRYHMPAVKNAAGYYVKDNMDAVDLFVGQEGTLGVILNAGIRLLDMPGGILDCYAFFEKEEDALSFVASAKQKGKESSNSIDALSLEYLGQYALELLRQKHKNIPSKSKAAIYFEQEIDKDAESVIIDAWAGLITECNGLLDDTWFAQTAAEKDKLAEVRHDLPDMVNEYLKKKNFQKIGTDIAVRDEHLREMLCFYRSALNGAGLKYLIFGHIGESHLHVNILPRSEEELFKAKKVYEALVGKAIALGGTPTAEHGIGKVKHQYLKMLYGENGVCQMAMLKKKLDKSGILGQDNIFSKELLRE